MSEKTIPLDVRGVIPSRARGMSPGNATAYAVGEEQGGVLPWSIAFVALTTLLFVNVSSTLAGAIFIATSLICMVSWPVPALRALTASFVPWTYLLLATVSLLWSPAPDVTIRYLLEVVFTAAAALVMTSAVAPSSFISALLCALLLVDMASVVSGRSALNAGAMAMIGVFGSKNAFSSMQAVLLLNSCWAMLSNRQSPFVRLLALLLAMMAPVLLLAGRSVDSTVPAIMGLGLSIVAYNMKWFSPRLRVIVLFAGIVLMAFLVVPALFFGDEIFGGALSLAGKDTTLTGRTYLWARAQKLIQDSPFLGVGFESFWVQGNAYAEELWAHFNLTGRGGFHFHNLWYELGVQLGYPGMIVVFITIAAVSLEVIRWAVRSPSAESCFFLGFVAFIDMRTMLEVDIFGQFSLLYVIFLAAGGYARNDARRGQRANNVLSRTDLANTNFSRRVPSTPAQ
jgi:exopolysaccharide production protein ExoQ